MIDVAFAVAYAVLLVAAIVVSRSLATAAILVAVGVGTSGVLVQFLATNGVEVRYRLLQWWLAVTLAAVVGAGAYLSRGRPNRLTRTAVILVGGSSAVVALGFVAARLLAPGSPGPLTSVGLLITRSSAEDNAKWLNAAAELAAGAPVDAWANVGGPLLLLLTMCATLLSTASIAFYGGVNEVAVSAGTLILAESTMIVLAPFALTPLVEARIRRRVDGRPRPIRSAIPWPMLLLGIAIAVTANTLMLYYGHLTLQYTMIVLALWVSAFVGWRRAGAALVLTTLAVVTVAQVWFPLSPVALILLVAGVGGGLWWGLRRRDRRALAVAASFGVTLVLMWDFLRSSISYSLGLAGDGASAATVVGGAVRGVVALAVPTLPLFAQNGGTEIVSTLFAAVTVAAVIAAVVVLREAGGRRYLLRFGPIVVLVGYTILVTFADYFAVGHGPGYATNKLTFAVAVPILAVCLPVGLLAFDRGARAMTALRWAALAGVVMLLVVDTFLPRAVTEFKPSLWPTTSGDPQPYWWPAEVRATADQPLATNPVGCVYLPQGAERPSVLPDGQRAYSCTRILTGVAGQEGPGQALVRWTLDEWLGNTSLWDHYQTYFALMSPDARNRKVILLDDDSRVVGIETLQSLMDRFPARPDDTGAADGSGAGS